MSIFNSGIDLRELCRFLRAIRRYNAAGIPIKSAIEFHIEASENSALRSKLIEVSKEMSKGEHFSNALKKHGLFERYVYELLHVGESTGNLGEVLNQIIFKMKNDIEVNHAVNKGKRQIYIFSGLFLVAFVYTILVLLPSSKAFMSSIGTTLPFATQIVFDFGLLCQKYWYLFLGGLAGMFFYFIRFKKEHPQVVEELMFKIPYMGALYRKQIHYQFCKVFEICLMTDFSAQKSLQYTASSINNCRLRSDLLTAIRILGDQGFELVEALKKTDKRQFFDKGIYPVLAAGIKSGTLEVILKEEAEEYKKDVLEKAEALGDNIGSIVVTPLVIIVFAFILVVIGLPMKEAAEVVSNYGF